MHRAHVVAALAWLSPACDCGGKIASDGGVEGASTWVCGDPNPPPVGRLCTEDEKSKCQTWAQSLVQTGYAHGACVQGYPTNTCVRGDQKTCRTTSIGICYCQAELAAPCDIGEVCVSDTQTGPQRCVKACSQ